MSKKLKRSAVALVLAATMVFSSQGVLTAFAAGGNIETGAPVSSALERSLDKAETVVVEGPGNTDETETPEVTEPCDITEGCTLSKGHEGECKVAPVDPPAEDETQPCTKTEGCTLENGHEGECVTEPVTPPEEENSEDETQPCEKTEGCTLPNGHEGECVVEENTEDTEDTQEPSEEDAAAVQAVVEQINALPTSDDLANYEPTIELKPEDEGYQEAYQAALDAYYSQIKKDVEAARAAYDALTEEQKVAFDATVLAKLTALEDLIAMREQADVLPETEEIDPDTVAIIETEEGFQQYKTLDEAVAAATDGATIEVLTNCTTTGMNLSKDLTITAAEGLSEKPTVTFTDKGIALWGISLTFKDCNVVMKGIGSTPYGEWSWQTICASKDASLTLDNVEMTMDASGTTNSPHAIYFCNNNVLNIINGSNLTIKNYANDALEWDGGDGGYNVYITDSTFISDHNRSGFTGTFYATITNSDVDVINSTGNGSNGSHFIIENSNVNFSNNGSHGLSAGALTIDNSTVTANNNKGMGITVNNEFEVTNNSVVTVTGNASNSSYGYAAVRLYNDFNFLVDNTSELYIKDNNNTGLYVRQGNLNVQDGAVLEITGNDVTHNALGGYGGGIYVGYGDNYDPTVVLPADAKIYNNHALVGGDDIYVSEGVNGPSLTFGKVGEGWTLDGDPDCTDAITGWFDDSKGSRWEAHDTPYHAEEFDEFEKLTGMATITGLHALKAAHGIDPIDPGEPGGGDWDVEHSKSKTATPLDANYESDVTLSLPSAEEQLVSDVVFVLDKSTSTDVTNQINSMLEKLSAQVEETGASVKVGIVSFNKTATVQQELTPLTSDTLIEIQEAINNLPPISGTNMNAGLLAGKKLLDQDTDVDASRKYLIVVSDGISYYYCKGTDYETAYTISSLNGGDDGNGNKNCQPNSGASCFEIKYGAASISNWSDWYADMPGLLSSEYSTYEYNVDDPDLPSTTDLDSEGAIPYAERQNYPINVDISLYNSYNLYQDMMEAGYHCYSVFSEEDGGGTSYAFGPAFMKFMGGSTYLEAGEDAFSNIQNDIFYLLDAGSSVVDVIGYGKDDSDNEYNFDFVDNLDNLKITVGGNELDKEDIIDPQFNDPYVTSAYGFYDPASGRDGYDFVLKYYQKGQDGNSDECFVWEINVPVSNFAPVQLTYTVKLTNPQTAEGTYGEYDANGKNGSTSLYTNKEATLYPVDSNGDSGVPENFPKPTVSYTVGGNDNPGTDPTPDPDPTPDRPSRPNRDDDDDWEPLPDAPVKDKPTTEVDVPEETETPTTEQPDKYNPETGDTTTVFAAMALAAVSLGGVVLLGRKKK